MVALAASAVLAPGAVQDRATVAADVAAAALDGSCTTMRACTEDAAHRDRDQVTGRPTLAGGTASSRAGTATAEAPPPVAGGVALGGDVATTVQYTGTDEVFADPERGFYHYTEARWSPDGSAYVPLDAAQLTSWRTEESVTLAYRVFYLGGLVDQDVIDQTFLTQVADDLSVARAAGVKLVLRFAYSADDGRDAPPERVVGQIRQLAPVLNAASDVVLVLQAGFIGRWGEWYYSEQYASDQAEPWNLTAADWVRRGRVLHALLDQVSPDIQLQVRYPDIKQRLLPASDSRAGRVGIHDDCFVASADDMGTFRDDGDRSWLAAQAASVPVGGETCAVSGSRSGWENAADELARYQWSFLNADFSTEVLGSWGADGRQTAARLLGYRLRLEASSAPATAHPGSTIGMSVVITNDGYAAPLSDRPVQLVLSNGTGTVRVPVPLSVRTLAAGSTRRVAFDVPVPETPGTWSMALALPDAAPALAGEPAYAIRLANPGVWDPVTGRNSLERTLQVG